MFLAALSLLLPSLVLCQQDLLFDQPQSQQPSFTARQFGNLSNANLLGLLLGIGSILALTLPFLYLASLSNGGNDTGGYGYGYQNKRTFQHFKPIFPQIQQWSDQEAQARHRDQNLRAVEFVEAGHAAYS